MKEIESKLSKGTKQFLSSRSTRGNKQFTFVCDAGMGNWSLFFQPLINKLEGLAPVYLIDRRGYSGFVSNLSTRDARTIAHEIKQDLDKEGIDDPIILVGHSIGGLHMRMFQTLYPNKVKGIVLLDAAHPQLLEKIPELRIRIEEQKNQIRKIIPMAKFGFLHLAKKRIPTFGLPSVLHKEYFRKVVKSGYYKTYLKEMEALGENLTLCNQLGNLGNLPLLVISSRHGLNQPVNSDNKTSGAEKRLWLELQKDLTFLSSNSTHVVSEGDHFVHISDSGTVARAIRNFYKKIISIR